MYKRIQIKKEMITVFRLFSCDSSFFLIANGVGVDQEQ
jgi:hypothetical protein